MNHIYTTNIISEGDTCIWERNFGEILFQVWEHTRKDGDKTWYIVCFRDGEQIGWQEIDEDGFMCGDYDGFPFADGYTEDETVDWKALDRFFTTFFGDYTFRQIINREHLDI